MSLFIYLLIELVFPIRIKMIINSYSDIMKKLELFSESLYNEFLFEKFSNGPNYEVWDNYLNSKWEYFDNTKMVIWIRIINTKCHGLRIVNNHRTEVLDYNIESNIDGYFLNKNQQD